MKRISVLLLTTAILFGPLGQVLADPLFKDSDESSPKFHGHLDDFARTLSQTGEQMRESYDLSALDQARQNMAESKQNDTQALLQHEFQKGIMQSQPSIGAYNGSQGGFVNNGGLFGSGIGAHGLFDSNSGGFAAGSNSPTLWRDKQWDNTNWKEPFSPLEQPKALRSDSESN